MLDGEEKPERREQILMFIKAHPGTHLREIKRRVGVSMGVVQYHLHKLERDRVVLSRRRGLYRRYYHNLVFNETDQDVLDILSQETERDILLYTIWNPATSQGDLVAYTKLTPSTVLWHLRRLVDSRLLEAQRHGASVTYSIGIDEDAILKLLKAYHPTVWDRWSDRIADVVVNVEEQHRERARIA